MLTVLAPASIRRVRPLLEVDGPATGGPDLPQRGMSVRSGTRAVCIDIQDTLAAVPLWPTMPEMQTER